MNSGNNITNYPNYCNCNNTMESSHWYNAPVPGPTYNFIMDTQPSNSREMRNKAEKMRRDKLNSYISELSNLVPLIAKSPKRMDKTSILRLTATHLRIYQTIMNGMSAKMNLPRYIDQNVLENLVYEQLGGFLLIITQTGKIVFISQTIENILGHLQTDLMGQSIFNITAQEDHDRFRYYLLSDPLSEGEWRKYFNIRLKRAGPRSESPVYATVNVMGMQKVVNNPHQDAHTREIAANNDMWIFFVRINRPQRLTEQLIEASNDEYVTRHLVDGRIINCDQRISIIAGYMNEEVSGTSAFQFMHKEDVRWVMVALRQMYDKGESKGSSCYRLLTKPGQFIYLRTYGFLEVDSKGTVGSFICINTLVSEKEGLQLIQEMKHRFSALITSIAPHLQMLTNINSDPSIGEVEDPLQLEEAVALLITNLPSPDSETSESHENQDWASNSTDSSSSPRPHRNIYIKLKPATKRPIMGDYNTSSLKRQRIEMPLTSPYQRPKITEVAVRNKSR